MLQIIIPEREFFDDENQEFIVIKPISFQIEHSLVSLSKWEEKWNKPLLEKKEKTDEETIDYIRCMTLTQNVNSSVYDNLPDFVFSQINEYIDQPMTATWFSKNTVAGNNKQVITAELIYYWMIAQQIPSEYRKWHLNKLLTLIRVCNIKNSPPKKMSKREMLTQREAINMARREEMNSKG